MGTIADAKVAHNYNFYNGSFFGCLPYKNGGYLKMQKAN